MNTPQRTHALQPLRQAVKPLAHHGRTSSTLLVADLADGRAGTDVVLALVEVHLANPDRDPALVAGLQRLLAEDENKNAAEGEDAGQTATHVDQYGGADHDLDENHVPYSLG